MLLIWLLGDSIRLPAMIVLHGSFTYALIILEYPELQSWLMLELDQSRNDDELLRECRHLAQRTQVRSTPSVFRSPHLARIPEA